MQKGRVEDTEIRCSTACFCCILQREKKPLQGQTATAKLRMKTHSPVTEAAFLHTQKPQLLVFSRSCCRGITEQKSASGALTAQVGLGLGGSHWSDSHSHGPALAHTALQSHRGSKGQILTCPWCPEKLRLWYPPSMLFLEVKMQYFLHCFLQLKPAKPSKTW